MPWRARLWPQLSFSVFVWNCAGFSRAKGEALVGTGDVGEGTPDVVVLMETQRELPTQALPGYMEASEAQNAWCWLATAGALH